MRESLSPFLPELLKDMSVAHEALVQSICFRKRLLIGTSSSDSDPHCRGDGCCGCDPPPMLL